MNVCEQYVLYGVHCLQGNIRERSHMTSAAEGGRGFRNADGC